MLSAMPQTRGNDAFVRGKPFRSGLAPLTARVCRSRRKPRMKGLRWYPDKGVMASADHPHKLFPRGVFEWQRQPSITQFWAVRRSTRSRILVAVAIQKHLVEIVCVD